MAKGYENQKLRAESYAEFDYRVGKCTRSYRMVVVRKAIDVTSGQQLLFSKDKYFFYITNETADVVPSRELIDGANHRCNQENTISQLKACGALAAPLDNLDSNGAYMLFASLAWTLKLWRYPTRQFPTVQSSLSRRSIFLDEPRRFALASALFRLVTST